MNIPLTTMAIYLYSIVLEIIKLCILALGRVGVHFPRWHLNERFILPPVIKSRKNHDTIWLHGASLGEVKIILLLGSILLRKYPDRDFVLTAVSESGVKYLHDHKPENTTAIGFLPIDTIFMIKKMIQKFSISQLWIAETEIWPSMLWTCGKTNVSVNIVNARMEKQSFFLYSVFRFFFVPLFSNIGVILAQNKTYANRFKYLGAKKNSIHVIGNIKGYRPIQLPPKAKRALFRTKMHIQETDIVITVGCLHPDEAPIIKETMTLLHSKGFQWKWIIVPRHIEKVVGLQKEFGADILTLTKTQSSTEWSECIIASFGILEDMYMLSNAAILGGTFNSVGGHNIWEATQYAIPVFFGKDFHTQLESYHTVMQAGLGFSLSTAKELSQCMINTLVLNSTNFSRLQNRFIKSYRNKTISLEKFIP